MRTSNNLGLLLAKQGGLAEAIEQFREALRIDPGYAKAYFNLGKLYMQESRLDDAVRYFRHAPQLQPGVAEIHENLARTLVRARKAREYEEALRLLRSKAS
jgi:Flp pilus assembly protein TadD